MAFADSVPGAMRSFPLACRYLSAARVLNTFLDFPDESKEAVRSQCMRKCSSEPSWLLPAGILNQDQGKQAASAGDPDMGVFAKEQNSQPQLYTAKDGENSRPAGTNCGAEAVGGVSPETMWQMHTAGLCKPCRFFTTHVNACQ